MKKIDTTSKEKLIIESFAKTFNKIKRTDESTIKEDYWDDDRHDERDDDSYREKPQCKNSTYNFYGSPEDEFLYTLTVYQNNSPFAIIAHKIMNKINTQNNDPIHDMTWSQHHKVFFVGDLNDDELIKFISILKNYADKIPEINQFIECATQYKQNYLEWAEYEDNKNSAPERNFREPDNYFNDNPADDYLNFPER
jgi:hypothetical protein